MSFVMHNFYCTKCGLKGIPIQRKCSKCKEKFHKKKLYCLNCQAEINHIEITNYKELEVFQQNFKDGVYANE